VSKHVLNPLLEDKKAQDKPAVQARGKKVRLDAAFRESEHEFERQMRSLLKNKGL